MVAVWSAIRICTVRPLERVRQTSGWYIGQDSRHMILTRIITTQHIPAMSHSWSLIMVFASQFRTFKAKSTPIWTCVKVAQAIINRIATKHDNTTVPSACIQPALNTYVMMTVGSLVLCHQPATPVLVSQQGWRGGRTKGLIQWLPAIPSHLWGTSAKVYL